MSFSLIELLGRSCPAIEIVDVGAMWLGADAVTYKPLLKAENARVVGFEPVESECEKLNKMGMKHQTYLPYFIGDGTERTFYLTNYTMNASLYKPNMAVLGKFQQLPDINQITKTEQVKTKKLDDLAEIPRIDFLKVDVQGADLDVLKGAERHLETTVVVQVEVEFVQMYENQPLFADIDTYMRSRGFQLHALDEPMGRAFKPLILNNDPNNRFRQALWSDAVYVKDFTRLMDLTPEQLLRMAVIVHEVHGSPDLAGLALFAYDQKTKAGLWPIFMRRLTGKPPSGTPTL